MSRFTNTEIERGIIGSILYGVVGPDALLEFVDSEDYFTNKYLRIIYRSICRVHGRGLVVDITTISDDIINHKEIDSSHVRS